MYRWAEGLQANHRRGPTSGCRRVVGEGNHLNPSTIEAGGPRTLRWKCGVGMIGQQGEE